MSVELPEAVSGEAGTRGAILGDPRHVHKAMEMLITIRLALKSLELDHFHFSSTAAARVWAHLSELFSTGLSVGVRSLPLSDLHLFACVGNVSWAPLVVTAGRSWGYT